MDSIAFVILCWNSQAYIGNCLKSIAQMKGMRRRVIVIDNGSSDSSVSIINEFRHNKNISEEFTCELIRLDKNYGTTVSRNRGLTAILQTYPDTQYICILDSDTEVNEAGFLKMISVLKTDASIGLIGPRMHDSSGNYQVSGRNIPTIGEKLLKILPFKALRLHGEKMQGGTQGKTYGIMPVGYLMSACWLMRSDVYKELGGLDEKIFYAPEDAEYCIRCWKKGYRVVYCFDADILHHWQRLSRRKLFSKLNYEHIKGLAYLFMKHKYMFNGEKFLKHNAADGGKSIK